MARQSKSQCTATSLKDAMVMLQQVGGGPLGKFNKEYMAFTWNGVKRNFRNLLAWKTSTDWSAIESKAQQAPLTSYPRSAKMGSCSANYFGYSRICSACPVVTDLGAGKYPRYINEIVCNQENALCANNLGFCQTTVLNQQFLMATCDPNTGLETLETYTQPIRACCECLLL